jgi:hypothetical protein
MAVPDTGTRLSDGLTGGTTSEGGGDGRQREKRRIGVTERGMMAAMAESSNNQNRCNGVVRLTTNADCRVLFIR